MPPTTFLGEPETAIETIKYHHDFSFPQDGIC